MGQYFKLVNYDKKQAVNAWEIGSVAKFLEWCWNTADLLCFLLRKSDQGGGGDVGKPENYPHLGVWAGDHVALVGDYDSSGDFQNVDFEDISKELYPEYLRFQVEELQKEITEKEKVKLKGLFPDMILYGVLKEKK
jgi:hypothetical protein